MVSKPSVKTSHNEDTASENVDRQPLSAIQTFGLRLRERAADLRVSRSNLRAWTNTPNQTFGGYWNGERLPPSELLLDLADHLAVTPRWLLTGVDKAPSSHLMSVDEADFVTLNKYDLRNLSDTGKGDAVDSTPFRKDWLNRFLFTATGLWLTVVSTDYEALGMAEGDVIVCSDIDAAGPQDNWKCLFRDEYGVFAGRYIHGEAGSGWRTGIVTARAIAEAKVYPVARIRARILARL